MSIIQSQAVKGFIKMAFDGWEQNWHECHGGNLSYRLSDNDIDEMKSEFNFGNEWVELKKAVPILANDYFLVSASGKFFRNIKENPSDFMGVIQISESGNAYRKIWGFGFGNSSKPTSEILGHLMSHEAKKVNFPQHMVVYHAHPTNLIALSFVLDLDDVTFTKTLWSMMPECAMTFPEGIGVLPWKIPGGIEISEQTRQLMEQYHAVLWANHGVFVSGTCFDNTFGLMHTLEKASEIYLKILSTCKKAQIPSGQNLRDLAEAFSLDLPERFLN